MTPPHHIWGSVITPGCRCTLGPRGVWAAPQDLDAGAAQKVEGAVLSVDERGWGLLGGGFVGASGEEAAARTRDIYIPGLLPSLQPLLMRTR